VRLASTATPLFRRAAGALLGWLTACFALGMSPATHAAEASLHAGDVKAILAEIKRPGAKVVLVNVWATWCEPCREEMPSLLRFYRQHRAEGLRLLLVSVDDEANRDGVLAFLASQKVDFATWIKRGDDKTLMRALDPEWSGNIPASFLFDGRGKAQQRSYGPVNDEALNEVWERVVGRRKGPVRAPQPSR
jgi:thiol-disulfide isomerase/thioredoxin